MKPLYLFGGVPLSQMIMERVYAAERTANEAPALALSKRTTVWLTDMSKVMADPVKAQAAIADWIAYRDNFGIKIGDKEGDDFQQFDTNVSDFDGLVMTQYGLVAATAGCPITKLMGSSPGGFQATGEYDEASYHEMEESMQERDFSPLVERHHALVMRSEVLPKFEELADVEVLVKWHELDALTHIEQSTVNLNKAQTGAALIASGALSPADEHARVAADKESGYHGIGVDIGTEELPEDVDRNAAASAAGTGSRVEKAIVKKDKGESDGAAHDAYDPSEKRVPKGQSKGGQWTTSNPGSGYSQNKKGEWRTAQGGAVPKEHAARLKKLGVPPPWTDVRLNPSRSAALQAVGRDSKGKLQPRYTAKHSSAAAAEKFDRLKSFNAKAPKIRERAYADLADAKKSTKERDAAAVTALISRTGFRVGGEGGGGDVKAFGASSLRAAHVKIDGDQIAFRFPGKKGVMQNHRLVDKPLAAYIQARKKEVGQGRLFEVRDYNVRDYVHSTGGDKFKVHDFRTWVATTTAIAAIKKISPPRDAKRLKAKKKEVAKIVARKLGNNPSEALKSYIDPMVFSEWENLV
jgi:DNA topoisomerase IB